MLFTLMNKLRKALHKKPMEPVQLDNPKVVKRAKYYADIDKNLDNFRQIFNQCSDIKFREFEFGQHKPIKASLIFVDGLIDVAIIEEHVLKALLEVSLSVPDIDKVKNAINKEVQKAALSVLEIIEEEKAENIVNKILGGMTALLIDGADKALLIDAIGWAKRGISEPKTEVSIRGTFEHFIEDIRTNTSFIRRRIKSPQLKMKRSQFGMYTKTDVVMVYIEDLVSRDLVDEVEHRLKKIDTDAILYSENIAEFINDNPYSPFPQILRTERPDRVAANLLEGRMAIIVGGTPFVIVLPIIFFQLLQAVDDYTENFIAGSFTRLFRIISINLALLLPSLYIAITTFHPEMLPTSLLLSIAGTREGVPFPAVVEAVIMELTFEILREAGVRLPRQIGQAVSIVGALVIGQAAVQASLVSPIMVIVVALTGIASFTFPSYGMGLAIRMLRFPLMFLAATFGLYGIIIGLLVILAHLCSLRSFGVPYMSPLAPFDLRGMKDTPVRAPIWKMFTRPRVIGYKEPQRQDFYTAKSLKKPGEGGDTDIG